MSLLSDYETLLDLSQKMALLAREQAWDDLLEAESKRRELLKGMTTAELLRLPTAQQQTVAKIINQIQDFDQSVMEYVLPWQDHVRPLLASFEPKL